jgi:hypothetical protein
LTIWNAPVTDPLFFFNFFFVMGSSISKGKVFGLIVLVAIVIAILSYFDILGDNIEVKAHYVEYGCNSRSIDMRVYSVSDRAFNFLIGKNISPRLTIGNKKLQTFIKAKVKSEDGKRQSLSGFAMVGYIRQGFVSPCSGSLMFKVKKIKYEGEKEFNVF